MLQAGLLEPIVAETRNALDPKSKNDHETIRYCLLVIANLSVSRENHPRIMSQCLETLTGFSKHQDIKARQHAVFVLGNLCANHDNIQAVVVSGALKTLITYAFPSMDTSINVQFQAIAALRGISTHQTLRMQVVREGGLEPLVLAARSDSIEVQRETAATLANLALAEENKVSGVYICTNPSFVRPYYRARRFHVISLCLPYRHTYFEILITVLLRSKHEP